MNDRVDLLICFKWNFRIIDWFCAEKKFDPSYLEIVLDIVTVFAIIFIFPFIHGASARIHKEISNGSRFQSQLPCNRHLHLFRRPFCFLYNSMHNEKTNDYYFRINQIWWAINFVTNEAIWLEIWQTKNPQKPHTSIFIFGEMWLVLFVWIRTLNIACSVRRCRSVNTSRGFFGEDRCSATTGKSSFRLHPVNGISIIISFVKENIK